ncbi:DNA repair protein-like protein rhp57 [Lipomyces kononenkoae]|uniref:DNA repair protein-like protein rhp57 n=1 Tax=Lipomyces kononenkoae TaxID=34357 RepID=A0ACC3T706_LIPKO
MTDLSRICPSFPHNELTNSILSSTDAANLTTGDLLTLSLDALAKRTGRNVVDLRRFLDILMRELVPATPAPLLEVTDGQGFISTGDELLDKALGGRGLATGCITEFVGASSVGKSHILMQLCLSVQLSPVHGGLSRKAVYISTESGLETRRLNQLLSHLRTKYPDEVSNLKSENVLCITCGDLEVQEHIIRYQLPFLVRTNNIGLIVVDSIASHYRAEHGDERKMSLHYRGNELIQCAEILRNLAVECGCAVAVANQIRDQFAKKNATVDNHVGAATFISSQPSQEETRLMNPFEEIFGEDADVTLSAEFQRAAESQIDIFDLDYQSRFFSGWDWLAAESSGEVNDLKVPALGLIWTNCVSQRAVLKRKASKRTLEVVFSPYAPSGQVLDFEIRADGVRGVGFV